MIEANKAALDLKSEANKASVKGLTEGEVQDLKAVGETNG